jgi:hypothetical protein
MTTHLPLGAWVNRNYCGTVVASVVLTHRKEKTSEEISRFSPLQGFHKGWAKPETHGFQTQEPSLKPETQHETHSC